VYGVACRIWVVCVSGRHLHAGSRWREVLNVDVFREFKALVVFHECCDTSRVLEHLQVQGFGFGLCVW